jgi:hypothetical protein
MPSDKENNIDQEMGHFLESTRTVVLRLLATMAVGGGLLITFYFAKLWKDLV